MFLDASFGGAFSGSWWHHKRFETAPPDLLHMCALVLSVSVLSVYNSPENTLRGLHRLCAANSKASFSCVTPGDLL